VRVTIILALRHSSFKRDTSNILSGLLVSPDKLLRTAALIALQPANTIFTRKPLPDYDVSVVLSSLEAMTSSGIRLGDVPIILSIISERPFLSLKRAYKIAERLAAIQPDDPLAKEAVAYFRQRIADAAGTPPQQ
jgi:hypothetical protein